MKNRTRNEIRAEILVHAQEIAGVTKTSIMYTAYLSFTQLRNYLEMLTNNGLLELTEKNPYRTTAKGMNMLEVFSEVSNLAKL